MSRGRLAGHGNQSPSGVSVLGGGLNAVLLLIILALVGCGGSAPTTDEVHYPKIYAVEQQEIAATALREGNEAAAMAAADRAIAHDPAYPDPYAIKASILARRGDFTEARTVLDAAITLRPDFAEGYLVRGALLEELKQNDDARNDYARAATAFDALTQANPDDPGVALKHALAAYLRGGTDGLRAINTLVTKFPDFTPGRFVKERMDAGDRAFAFRWITGLDPAAAHVAPTTKD